MAPQHLVGSAVSRVLGTYELFQQILSHVPEKQLFVVQRVERAWKYMIEDSKVLRKKMFLEAEGPGIRPRVKARLPRDPLDYGVPVRVNPMLRELQRSMTCIQDWSEGQISVYIRRLFRLHPPRVTTNPQHHANGPTSLSVGVEPAAYAHYEHETWSEMYICQPPIVAISYQYSESRAPPSLQDRCTVYSPVGLTIGDLLHCERTILHQKASAILDTYDASSEWEFYRPMTNEEVAECVDGAQEMPTPDDRSTMVLMTPIRPTSGELSENAHD